MALLRQSLVAGCFSKDIETYGVVKTTQMAKDFLTNPCSFMVSADHVFEANSAPVISNKSLGIADKVLMEMFARLKEKSCGGS